MNGHVNGKFKAVIDSNHACISFQQVGRALDKLLYNSSVKKQSELTGLLLVQHLVSNPNMPSTPHEREFALNTILMSIITENYTSHRRVLELPTPSQTIPKRDTLLMIANDSEVGNMELICWSWLYHRYVRVELGITPGVFSQAAQIDTRTLRRYQRHGIARLTFRLIQAELEMHELEDYLLEVLPRPL